MTQPEKLGASMLGAKPVPKADAGAEARDA